MTHDEKEYSFSDLLRLSKDQTSTAPGATTPPLKPGSPAPLHNPLLLLPALLLRRHRHRCRLRPTNAIGAGFAEMLFVRFPFVENRPPA
eukprot:scaffold65776_cov51-Phaeocystis_antarctica.AAC.4